MAAVLHSVEKRMLTIGVAGYYMVSRINVLYYSPPGTLLANYHYRSHTGSIKYVMT